MAFGMSLPGGMSAGEFFVPGTGVTAGTSIPVPAGRVDADLPHRRLATRDPALRNLYLQRALAAVPRLLGAVDRNPFRPTYGCFDRQYWHYRTSSFPSEMYQEAVLPLALVCTARLPRNRWHGDRRVRELAAAGIRFAARSCHADGSCDDYYPFERALGAAVFSLQAAARAYQLLDLDEPALVDWFRRRGRWVIDHDESGRLANHQALAALGLLRVAEITGERTFRDAADARVDKLLGWQSDEGWFEEYGGADPGYQTLSIDCLAKYRHATGDERLGEPLRRAIDFARLFLHPDCSYGGEYGSRGTYHFYPHGMELLAAEMPGAADLAEGFLRSLASGTAADFSDDRLVAHQLGNLIEAYVDWTPRRVPAGGGVPGGGLPAPALPDSGRQAAAGTPPLSSQGSIIRYLPKASLLVRRDGALHTVISAARGGVFKHFAPGCPATTDAGLVVETADGRVAVSEQHELSREIDYSPGGETCSLMVSGPLDWTRFETVTPLKQMALHAGMCTVGRWCRTAVRRALQRRLITGRRPCGILLSRRFELFERSGHQRASLRVTDTIELLDPRLRVHRMSFGTDHQSAYVAASGVYQSSVLSPWADLSEHVARLNADRRVVVVRQWS